MSAATQVVSKLNVLTAWVNEGGIGDHGERAQWHVEYEAGSGFSVWASRPDEGHASVDDLPTLLGALTETVERLGGAEERQRQQELEEGASWLVRAVPGLSREEAVYAVLHLRDEQARKRKLP